MKCIRIKFVLPKHYNLSISKEDCVFLRLPEGNLKFKIRMDENDIYNSYTLKSDPLNVDIQSKTIDKIKNALHLSFLKYDVGLSINENLVSGFITETGEKEFGNNTKSDFIGVQIVDYLTKYPIFDTTINSKIPSDLFFKDLEININESRPIDDKLKRAIDLYNSTIYLDRVNNSGRFILLMSAIECLISPKENPSDIVGVIQKAQEEIKNIKNDKIKDSICSIIGSLNHLKKESISKSGKSLIEFLFNGSEETFKGYTPPIFFKKAYELRSQIVHNGCTSTKHLSTEDISMQEFTYICLKKYYEKSNSSMF